MPPVRIFGRSTSHLLRCKASSWLIWPAGRRFESTRSLDSAAIAELLSKPTWSVKALHGKEQNSKDDGSITREKLHHLLRLSALPLPDTDAEEAEMVKTLEAQLHFVRAVQNVDTTGVEPLQSLRDETIEAHQENEITVESLREHLAKESSVGFAGRIVREESGDATEDSQQYDPLSQAPRTIGRFVVVNTKES